MRKMSLIDSFTSNIVIGEITIQDLFERIRNNPQADIIERAREIGKETQEKRKEYDRLKAKLNCVSINATYNKRKRNENLKELSGYVYVDIDGQNFDINEFNSDPYVHASWYSISGKDVGAIIKTDNYNENKFKGYWSEIANYFKDKYGIELDKQTSHVSRLNAISYDRNIYINNDSLIFSVDVEEEFKPEKPFENIFEQSIGNRLIDPLTGKPDHQLINSLLKTQLPDELYNLEEECTYIEDGYDVRNIFIRLNSIKEGNRNRILLHVAYTIIYNMNDVNLNELTTALSSINTSRCQSKYSFDELKKLADNVLKSYNPSLVSTKKQKYWVNPYLELNKGEKISIINKMRGKHTKEKNFNKIINSIKNHPNLNTITQKEVAELSGRSIRTIKNYWKQIQQWIGAKPNNI
jgi:hypothetical protein